MIGYKDGGNKMQVLFVGRMQGGGIYYTQLKGWLQFALIVMGYLSIELPDIG